MAVQLVASPILIGERLAGVLQCFPAAAIRGVQWVTLVCKYREKYCTELDLSALGYESALAAASTMLRDVGRIVHAEDEDHPVLMIKDTVALTPQPGLLANWPSLYKGLNDIVRNQGTLDTTNDTGTCNIRRTILLSQVKPLLQSHWHKSFDDCGLIYYTPEGSTIKIKKMKHLLNSIFRWRADRLNIRASTRSSAPSLSDIDAAIVDDMDMIASEPHNDFLLRSFACEGIAKSIGVDNSLTRTDVIDESHSYMATLAPSVSSVCELDSVCSETCSTMKCHIARLRMENSQLRCENKAAFFAKMFDTHAKVGLSMPMDNIFDNPSEPPPAIWIPSSASTMPGSSSGSGVGTPITDASFSGSCVLVPHSENADGGTPISEWFPDALGDRVQIPNGIVQQACAVFEAQATIPSFFSR